MIHKLYDFSPTRCRHDSEVALQRGNGAVPGRDSSFPSLDGPLPYTTFWNED